MKPKGTPLSAAQRAQILALAATEAHTFAEIAAIVGCTPRQATYTIKRPAKPAPALLPHRRAIPQGNATTVPAVLLAPLPKHPPAKFPYYLGPR
jgi:hypothetical protein